MTIIACEIDLKIVLYDNHNTPEITGVTEQEKYSRNKKTRATYNHLLMVTLMKIVMKKDRRVQLIYDLNVMQVMNPEQIIVTLKLVTSRCKAIMNQHNPKGN